MMAASSNVQTVLGLVAPESLGPTMMHEHILADCKFFFEPPAEDNEEAKALMNAPITLENLYAIQYTVNQSLVNLTLDEYDVMAEEIKMFAKRGGGTIVDVTPRELALKTASSIPVTENAATPSSHAEALRSLSQQTGVHIVMGTAFYVDKTRPEFEKRLSVADMEELMVAEVNTGVEVKTSDGRSVHVRAGIIGEMGCSYPLTESERKALVAASNAQKRTGAAISVHVGRNHNSPLEIIDVLQSAGADLSRTIVCHLDRTLFEWTDIEQVARTGVVMEYDLFGLEVSNYTYNRDVYMPNDEQRIGWILKLVQSGYGRRIVVSHDVYSKHRLHRYGGHGYDHVIKNIVPRLKWRGIPDEVVDAIIVKTPAELLTIKK